MSEELAEASEQVSEATQQSENVTPEPQTNDNQRNDKPAGYHPVSLDGVDPDKARQIEDRFGYFYGQVKKQDRALNEYRSVAEEQARLIEDLRNGMFKVVDHLETKDTQNAEATLRQEMREAFQTGDENRYQQLQEKLLDLKLETKIKKIPQPQQAVQKQQLGAVSASSIARDAVAGGEISSQEAQLIDAWQNEKDDSGQSIRPWAHNNNGKPSPDFAKAYLEAQDFLEENPSASMNQLLAHLDKQMGTKNRQQNQTVMGGSLTSRPKNTKLTLSAKQQEIAVRTKFGSNKGAKTDAEFIEHYRKQVEATRKGAK